MRQSHRLLTTSGLAVVALLGPGRGSAGAIDTDLTRARNTAVFISAQSSTPDYVSPWQRIQGSRSGSGVIIEGQRILTNAHVVLHGTAIEVKREGLAGTFPATVEYISNQCDLALLSVSTPKFFAGIEPLPLGELPQLQQAVQVVGYPMGGDAIALTSGVTSRVEMGLYSHAMTSLLRVQIDAAINPGNSGGPVISKNHLVGLATQVLEAGENIGHMIPIPVIRHFLTDIADGQLDGLPELGFRGQSVNNAAFRKALKLPDELSGIAVVRTKHGSPSDEILLPDDVIIAIEGFPIDEDFMVNRPGHERLDMKALLQEHQMGETITLDVWRNQSRRSLKCKLRPWRDLVSPFYHYPRSPDYVMFAGFVIQPLTPEYLWSMPRAPNHLLQFYLAGNPEPDRTEAMLISHIFRDPVNRGYEFLEGSIMSSVNGQRIRNFRHLVELLDGAQGSTLELRSEDNYRIVLDLAEARRVTPVIQENHGMHASRSVGHRP